MGLYGERVGLVSAVVESANELECVESQFKSIARQIYSNPPINGARIAEVILSSESLKKEWIFELKQIQNRLSGIRKTLRDIIENEYKSPHSWAHITSQIGMFCYTGLTEKQVDSMVGKYSIYMTRDGRISVAGLNESNVSYVAKSIHEVTTGI